LNFRVVENEITNIIIREAIYIHRALGPGLLESAYKECLHHRILENALVARKEVPVPLVFESIKLECGYRADLIVEKKVIVEIKCVEAIADIHKAQLLTYLKLTNLKLGLLLNFNSLVLKDGIKRIVNNF
jgi:GxxExxY protein